VIILGFDPGLATVGYGIIEHSGGRSRAVDYGVITTPKDESLPARLHMIYDASAALIAKHSPDAIAVEELFFAKNVKTGIQVAHARGVLMYCAVKHTGRLYEYTPLQIKQALTGYGRAEKNQIQEMVKMLLGLSVKPRPDDAADALAVAITHAHFGESMRNNSIIR
jgi:crossover junction endodeoxyribonuclease RuvC